MTAGRHSRPVQLPRASTAAAVAMAVVAFAIAVYTAAQLVAGADRLAVVAPVAGCLLIAFAIIAVVRIELFVLCVLAVRSSLDAVKVGEGTSAADPAAMLAVLMLGTVAVWVVAQRAHDDQRPRWSPALRGTAVFGVVAVIGVVTSTDPVTSATWWLRLASAVPMLLIVEQLARDTATTKRVLAACFAAIPVPLVIAGLQLLTKSGFLVRDGFDRVRGTFTHSNPFAIFLVMAMLMAIGMLPYVRGRWRWAALTVIVLSTPLLLLTYTRSAWIGLFVGVVLIGLVGSRRVLAGALALTAAVALAVPSVVTRFGDLDDTQQASGAPGNSLSWRFAYWAESMEYSEASPISGVGLNTVASHTEEGKQPHNDFVRSYVEMGVLGLLAYAYMLVQLIRTGWWAAVVTRTRRDLDRGIALGFLGVSVAFVVMSLVGNLMSQVVLLWYLTAYAGLAAAVIARRMDNDERSAPSA